MNNKPSQRSIAASEKDAQEWEEKAQKLVPPPSQQQPELSPEGEVVDVNYLKEVIKERNGLIEVLERDNDELRAQLSSLSKQLGPHPQQGTNKINK